MVAEEEDALGLGLLRPASGPGRPMSHDISIDGAGRRRRKPSHCRKKGPGLRDGVRAGQYVSSYVVQARRAAEERSKNALFKLRQERLRDTKERLAEEERWEREEKKAELQQGRNHSHGSRQHLANSPRTQFGKVSRSRSPRRPALGALEGGAKGEAWAEPRSMGERGRRPHSASSSIPVVQPPIATTSHRAAAVQRMKAAPNHQAGRFAGRGDESGPPQRKQQPRVPGEQLLRSIAVQTESFSSSERCRRRAGADQGPCPSTVEFLRIQRRPQGESKLLKTRGTRPLDPEVMMQVLTLDEREARGGGSAPSEGPAQWFSAHSGGGRQRNGHLGHDLGHGRHHGGQRQRNELDQDPMARDSRGAACDHVELMSEMAGMVKAVAGMVTQGRADASAAANNSGAGQHHKKTRDELLEGALARLDEALAEEDRAGKRFLPREGDAGGASMLAEAPNPAIPLAAAFDIDVHNGTNGTKSEAQVEGTSSFMTREEGNMAGGISQAYPPITTSPYVDVAVSESCRERLEQQRLDFAAYRRHREKPFTAVGMVQSDLIEVIADNIVEDLMEDLTQEVEGLLKGYAEQLLNSV
ncbi:unnamed protein product [Chrysoparadoxa australica]